MHPDLYIPIPDQIDERVKPYWGIVERCNGSREAMVNFICGIGGYSSGYHERYALEWDVGCYYVNLDAEHLWEKLCSDSMDVGPDKDWTPQQLALARQVFDEQYEECKEQLFDWGLESARDMGCTPYYNFAGLYEPMDWKFEFAGRGGKHLVMTEWDGWNTTCTTDELEERLNEKEDEDDPDSDYCIPHSSVRNLFIICVQNSIEMTPRKASEEVEYQAAWQLWANIVEPEIDAKIEELMDAEEDTHS